MQDTTAFTARFEAFANLAPHERRLLDTVANGARTAHPLGSRLKSERRFLCAGWAAAERWISDSRRQLLQLCTIGEPLTFDETPGHLTVVALTPAVSIDGTRIFSAAGDETAHPGLAKALFLMQAEVGFFAREHIVRLGRMNALERMASFLVEISYRNRWSDRFRFPLTQTHLADLLGLSVVHVNRTLQELRRIGAIEYRHHTISLLDRGSLCELASFVEPALKR